MANKVFHFSNTGISSGQRFYLKDGVSGIFLNKLNINSDSNIVANNLVYNTGNQNISGIKTFASRPTVNGTGVLLSGQNSFVIKFDHLAMNMNNNTFYFTNMSNLSASTTSSQRRLTMMQSCRANFASWSTFTSTAREGDSSTIKSSGYFVNTTTNVSGLITNQYRHASNGSLFNFTGNINPPVDINFGDQVNIELRVPNYETGMSGNNNSVNVFFN